MIYSSDYSIIDSDSIVSSFRSMNTQFNVVQGRINTLITQTGVEEMASGDKSIYTQMSALEQTVEGFSTVVTDMQRAYDIKLGDYYTKSETTSKINQSANEISTSVNTKLQDYATISVMNSAITQKADQISLEVNQTLEDYSTTDETNRTISSNKSWVRVMQGRVHLFTSTYNRNTQQWQESSIDLGDAIRIQAANGISWHASNSEMTEDGTLICNGGKIAGWEITKNYLQGSINGKYTYIRKPSSYPSDIVLAIGATEPFDNYNPHYTDAPFKVRADGSFSAYNAFLAGSLNTGNQSSGYYLNVYNGFIEAGYNGNDRGRIDASAVVNDLGAGVTRYGIVTKSGCVQFQTDLISATPSKNDTNGYTGMTGWLNVVTEIRDIGNGRVAWTTKPIFFQHGLMCTDIS